MAQLFCSSNHIGILLVQTKPITNQWIRSSDEIEQWLHHERLIFIVSQTSTSIRIEVAAKFSGPDGIVIMFNNHYVYPYCNLQGFNVSWISRYKEEEERFVLV